MAKFRAITNNVVHLTDEEQAAIRASEWFMYCYGVGVIMTDNNIWWDCTNSADAKDYLHKLGKQEKK